MLKQLLLIEKQTQYVWSAIMIAVLTFVALFVLGMIQFFLEETWLFYLVALIGFISLASIKSKYTPVKHLFNIEDNNELKYKDESIKAEEEPNEFIVKECSLVDGGLQVNMIATGAIKRKVAKLFKTELLGEANVTSLRQFIDNLADDKKSNLDEMFECEDSKIKSFGKVSNENFFVKVAYKPELIPVGTLAYVLLIIGIYLLNKFVGVA